MLAPLMKSEVIAFFCTLLVVAAVAVGLGIADAQPWVTALVFGGLFAVRQIYCKILVPRGARRRLLKAVDPTAGPPPGAARVDSPLIDQLDRLGEAKDWDAMRALLSDDFALIRGRIAYGKGVYIRVLKAVDRQFTGTSTTDEVVVHPDEPDVMWVRSTSNSKPRFGPGFVSTTWTRITVTPDRTRVCTIEFAGVLNVA
jgi:hypothetical protein